MDLLIPKAKTSLERYGHQVVIGNELHSRKYQVVFVARTSEGTSNETTQSFEEKWIRIDEEASQHGKEIEEDIITELARSHTAWRTQRR